MEVRNDREVGFRNVSLPNKRMFAIGWVGLQTAGNVEDLSTKNKKGKREEKKRVGGNIQGRQVEGWRALGIVSGGTTKDC